MFWRPKGFALDCNLSDLYNDVGQLCDDQLGWNQWHIEQKLHDCWITRRPTLFIVDFDDFAERVVRGMDGGWRMAFMSWARCAAMGHFRIVMVVEDNDCAAMRDLECLVNKGLHLGLSNPLFLRVSCTRRD